MTRKTAMQLLLCIVGYPAFKVRAQEGTISTIDSDLTIFKPTTLTINFDYIKEIHLMRGDKRVVVKMEDIWEALEPKP